MIGTAAFWAILVVTALVYWCCPPKIRRPLLLVVSLGYLAAFAPIALVIVLVGSFLFYRASLLRTRDGASKGAAISVSAAALIAMAVFKWRAHSANVLVPLGLSYVTFKWISYAIDCVRGGQPAPTWLRFLLYSSFLPTFSAGPIERFEPFAKNDPASFDGATFCAGVARVTYGLVKKFVLVDIVLSHPSEKAFDFYLWTVPSLDRVLLDATPAWRAWQWAGNALLTTYLDFSAYSDIAIGAALVFGYRIGENFDYPLLATSVGDFWRRWHISLSAWCQRYVYMPTLVRTKNPYLAVYAAMIVMGVWHAPTWGLVIWGLYHGTLLGLFHVWGRVARERGWRFTHPLSRLLGWAVTMTSILPATCFMSTADRGVAVGLKVFVKLFGLHRV